MNMNEMTTEDRKDALYGYISDASKDAQGFRLRLDISEMTVAELEVEADYWSGRVIESIKEDDAREAAAIASFETTVAKAIESGAGDRETAIRWVKSAWADDGFGEWYGDEHLEYNLGVPFGFFKGLEAAA